MELKPCPFCGYKAKIHQFDENDSTPKFKRGKFIVQCGNGPKLCAVWPRTNWYHEKEENAIAAWNKRKYSTRIREAWENKTVDKSISIEDWDPDEEEWETFCIRKLME